MDEHSHATFKVEGETLLLESFGPFNEEGVMKVYKEYLDQVSRLKHAPFNVIELWDNETLSSPEAMDKIAEMWRYLSENNCKKIAVVVSNGVQKMFCEKSLPNIGQCFLSVEEARDWI